MGTTNAGPCVSVIKLEREEGVRVRLDLVDGQRVIDLEFLRDLTLTDKTKVFKTSILVLDDADITASLYGAVSDDQRGRIEGGGVANFRRIEASPFIPRKNVRGFVYDVATGALREIEA